MPGAWIVVQSSEAWPEAGAQAERALNIGWTLDNASFSSTGGVVTNISPSTATAFLSSGDGTTGSGNGFYAINRRLRVIHGGASTDTTYCEVSAASYGAPETTVTVSRVTSGATALSTAAIASVGAGPVWTGSTDGQSPFPAVISLSSGGPTDPSLRWWASTGTGFYLSASNVLGVAVGSTGVWSFSTGGHFYALTDNVYQIGSSGATNRPAYVYVGTAIIGTSTLPAQSGVLRVGNNEEAVVARNAANTLDVGLIRLSGANRVILGSSNIGSATQPYDQAAGTFYDLSTLNADGTGHMPANRRVWQTGTT